MSIKVVFPVKVIWGNSSSFEIIYNPEQALIKETKLQFQPPNPEFIFHNKLPKSGSSTMNQIFSVLSQWNKFNHFKLNGNAIRKSGFPLKGFQDEGLFQLTRG